MSLLFHTLYFEATRNCNLNCSYCSTGSNSKDKFQDLSFDIIVERIFKPAKQIGTKQIDFSGGEFLVRADAYKLLDVANRMGFRISIVSNGTTLSEKVLSVLKEILGDNLLISLGVNEFSNKNKQTRDYESDKILQIVDNLEKFNIAINICVTVGRFNCESFSETISIIDSLKLPYNRIPMVPRNANCKDLMFNKKLMQEKIHPTLRKYYRGYVSYVPFFLPPEHYEKVTQQNIENSLVPTNPSLGCWVGSFYGINAEGDVSPCPLLLDNISGGNVLEQNLEDILFNSNLFKNIVRRENLKGKCGTCKYNFTCGGCRAVAYYKTGDVYGEDPDCFIDMLSDEELKNLEKETIKGFKNYNRMAGFANVFNKDKF